MPYRSSAARVVTSERLILRPEYHPVVIPVLTVLSAAGVIYAALGHTIFFSRSNDLIGMSVIVFVGCVYFHLTRVVFEIEGKVLRGYRRKLGFRTRLVEHPLDDVQDIGIRMRDTGDGTACNVVLIRREGGYVVLDSQLLLCFIDTDPDLQKLRAWFLERRYPESRPADLPDAPVTIFE